MTSFLPDLILGLSYVLASLIYAEAVCLPITVQGPQGSGKDWVLLGIWLTPDSRVYFYHPSGQIGPWKQRVGSLMTHFGKVKCTAQQLSLSCIISSKLQKGNHKHCWRCLNLQDEMHMTWLQSCSKTAVKTNNAPMTQIYVLSFFCQGCVQVVV